MQNLIIIITVFILGLSIYMYFENKSNDLVYVKSKLDNKDYLVQRFPDSDKAAILISKTRHNLDKLVNYCYKKYKTAAIKRLKSKFNSDSIVEVGKGSKYTSYSINKGEKIVLCLRSRDGNNKLIDENTLMFVAIHELAHIMTFSIGHTEEFWDNFRFLLRNAIQLKIYKDVDYNKYPQKYCGITVTSNPLY